MILPDLVFANGQRLVPIANMEAVMWFSRCHGCCVYGIVIPEQKDNQTHLCLMRQISSVCMYICTYACFVSIRRFCLLSRVSKTATLCVPA